MLVLVSGELKVVKDIRDYETDEEKIVLQSIKVVKSEEDDNVTLETGVPINYLDPNVKPNLDQINVFDYDL